MFDQVFELLEQAFMKMRDASFQSHNGHWDSQGTGGANCHECVRSRELRKEADDLFDRAIKLKNNIDRLDNLK